MQSLALKSEVMALEGERSEQELAAVYMEPPRKCLALSRNLDIEIEWVRSTSIERAEHEN